MVDGWGWGKIESWKTTSTSTLRQAEQHIRVPRTICIHISGSFRWEIYNSVSLCAWQRSVESGESLWYMYLMHPISSTEMTTDNFWRCRGAQSLTHTTPSNDIEKVDAETSFAFGGNILACTRRTIYVWKRNFHATAGVHNSEHFGDGTRRPRWRQRLGGTSNSHHNLLYMLNSIHREFAGEHFFSSRHRNLYSTTGRHIL